MPEEFVLLSANFKDIRCFEELRGNSLSDGAVVSLLNNSIELIRKKAYDFAAIDNAGIAKFAEVEAKKTSSITDFISILRGIKPQLLETQLRPFCKDDRSLERIIEKKLGPMTEIALCRYISFLFERIFPIQFRPSGKPQKKDFRFAANYKGWVAVRKANLELAENKEVLASLVHALGTICNKLPDLHENKEFFTRLNALLSKYPPRKSFGKLIALVEEMQKAGIFDESDPLLRKYALMAALSQMGFPAYLSGESLEGIYPELKIPKPKGRIKKG